MLILQHVTYAHPNKDILFDAIGLTIGKQEKVALIGNNGSGKSTLLKIIAGELAPQSGAVSTASPPYYVPQLLGQFNEYTVAAALRIDKKLEALHAILGGRVTEEYLTLLDDDWGIEERCYEALAQWKLDGPYLGRKMGSLSGGQKTKVFLAGIAIHRPGLVLLDEPSNHLDTEGRALLYDYIRSTAQTLIMVSHDKTLLSLADRVCELDNRGLTLYGGSYDFFTARKAAEKQALQNDIKHKEKALRKAKEIEKASLERQQKLDARGKKKQEQAGLPTIVMNTFRNNAEKSTARMKEVHAEKTEAIARDVAQLRRELPGRDKMKVGFDDSSLHQGKILISAREINYACAGVPLWKQPLTFEVCSGRRIALNGLNGSGKTTLIRILLGALYPSAGTIERAAARSIYIDQDYSLIGGRHSVYEQAQLFNSGHLQEHEVKSRLTHFLFTGEYWHKPCSVLSGGEKMRLLLCCLTLGEQAPDIIVLDEPTNNLDIQNTEILTAALNDYRGTVIVVSHDTHFLEAIGTTETITLP